VTETQLYLAIGVPSFVALVGILVNVAYFISLNSRMTSMEGRMSSMENRLDGRITNLEVRFGNQLDVLISKVVEMDNRLSRVEERLKM